MDQNYLYPAKTIWENKTPSGTASAAGGVQFAQFNIKEEWLNLALYFWLYYYLSIEAQPVIMRLTHKVLFRFFSVFLLRQSPRQLGFSRVENDCCR